MQDELKKAIELILDRAKTNLIIQGHVVTSDLLNSLETNVYSLGETYYAELKGLEYGLAQDTGIQAGTFKGNNGDHILNLIDWISNKLFYVAANRRGAVAFIIAKTHQLKGMHTNYGFPDVNKQKWLSDAIDESLPDIEQIIDNAALQRLDVVIKNLIDESKRNVIL